MSPLVGRYRPSSSRPKVVLPEPVSPTRARVCPRRMARDTPSTALSVGRGPWPGTLAPALKCLATSRVSMIGPLAPAPSAPAPASPAASAGWISLAALMAVSVRYEGFEHEPPGVRPAVDLQHGAGDVAGRTGGQEQDRLRDVRRVARMAQRDRPDQRRAEFLRRAIRERLAPLPHVDVAGRDDIDPDPVRPEFHGEDLAHGLDGGLGGTVGGAAGPGVAGRPAGDADHRGVLRPPADAVPRERLGHQE